MTKFSDFLSIRFLSTTVLSCALFLSQVPLAQAADNPRQDGTSEVVHELVVVWKNPADKRQLTILSEKTSLLERTPQVSVMTASSPEEYNRLMRELSQNPLVLSVEPNQKRRLPDMKKSAVSQSYRQAKQAGAAETPNDTYYHRQWALPNMHVPQAWELLPPSSKTIKVAVIDSGADLSHPDLTKHLLPGKDYIDQDDTPNDVNGHGTHVSGIIAAETNNRAGIAGLSGPFDVKIIPLKIFDETGTGDVSDEVSAIYDAVAMGADVINLSLGSNEYHQAEADAIAFAAEKGVVVVAASGNDSSAVSYPAALPESIAVAATASNDEVTDYSNFGSQVDVAAPGDEILSAYPRHLVSSGYVYGSGTSMAAPQVSALAALLKGHTPELTKQDIEELIYESAVDIGNKGKDVYSGHGKVDFLEAVQLLQKNYPPGNKHEIFALSELVKDPKAFYEILQAHGSKDLHVKAEDGTVYGFEELVNSPSQLHRIASQADSKLLVASSEKNDRAFLSRSSLRYGKTNVHPTLSFSLSLDIALSAQNAKRYLKLVDPAGRSTSGIRIFQGSNGKLFIEANRSLRPKTTYRLMYANTIPFAEFTTSSFEMDYGVRVTKKFAVRTGIPFKHSFNLRLSYPVKLQQLTVNNAWILDEHGKKIKAELALSKDQKTITVEPKTRLKRGTLYSLLLLEDHRKGQATLVPFRTAHE